MKEIQLFRQTLDGQSREEFNKLLVRFSDAVAEAFKTDFPKLHPEAYKSSALWLALVGTQEEQRLAEPMPPEVQKWLEIRVTGFFRAIS